MADRTDRGMPDPASVSGSQDAEIRQLARRHNLTVEEARELIARHGKDREKLEAEAETLDRGQGP